MINGELYEIRAWGDDKDCQLLEFMTELAGHTSRDAERIYYLMRRTADIGPPRNNLQCRYIGDDLFEFKAPGGTRVLWFYDEGFTIVCTHAFVKKSQRTPKDQKNRAIDIRRKYFEEKWGT